jgi:hypothetical protein
MLYNTSGRITDYLLLSSFRAWRWVLRAKKIKSTRNLGPTDVLMAYTIEV